MRRNRKYVGTVLVEPVDGIVVVDLDGFAVNAVAPDQFAGTMRYGERVVMIHDGRRLVALGASVQLYSFYVLLCAWDSDAVVEQTMTVGGFTWILQDALAANLGGGAAFYFCPAVGTLFPTFPMPTDWGGPNVRGGRNTEPLGSFFDLTVGTVGSAQSLNAVTWPPIFGDYGGAILVGHQYPPDEWVPPTTWVQQYKPVWRDKRIFKSVFSEDGKGFAAMAPFYVGSHNLAAGFKRYRRYEINIDAP